MQHHNTSPRLCLTDQCISFLAGAGFLIAGFAPIPAFAGQPASARSAVTKAAVPPSKQASQRKATGTTPAINAKDTVSPPPLKAASSPGTGSSKQATVSIPHSRQIGKETGIGNTIPGKPGTSSPLPKSELRRKAKHNRAAKVRQAREIQRKANTSTSTIGSRGGKTRLRTGTAKGTGAPSASGRRVVVSPQ